MPVPVGGIAILLLVDPGDPEPILDVVEMTATGVEDEGGAIDCMLCTRCGCAVFVIEDSCRLGADRGDEFVVMAETSKVIWEEEGV